MSNGREEARENVHQQLGMHSPEIHDFMDECADAASDYWEPLLRNLVDAIPYASNTEAIINSYMYIEAVEAINE